MLRSKIAGTGRAAPSKVLTNDDLSQMVETSDAWIAERTGIRERRILEEGRVTSDLATEAALRALEAAGMTAAELDLIICATISPDMPLPACAVIVQQKLGARCPAFDLAAACAGFIYGASVADAFIKAGTFKKVLVIGVEILSRVLDWSDRNTCVLFGDAAGAAIFTPSDDDSGVLSTHLFADGSLASILNIPGGGTQHPHSQATVDAKLNFVKMNGKAVFIHAVKNIASASETALKANGLRSSDVRWVVAHQANLRILEAVAQRLDIPMERFFLNIHKYGNTSSASIPMALDEAVREGKIKRGDLLLLSGLGAGLSWGSMVVRY